MSSIDTVQPIIMKNGNTFNQKIIENPTINIAILGCVSSGKSTLMNSFFAETGPATMRHRDIILHAV